MPSMRQVPRRLPACKAAAQHYHQNCKGKAGPFKDKDGEFEVVCDCPSCHGNQKKGESGNA